MKVEMYAIVAPFGWPCFVMIMSPFRLVVAQRQARHFIQCRKTRLYVMSVMWKKLLKEVSATI